MLFDSNDVTGFRTGTFLSALGVFVRDIENLVVAGNHDIAVSQRHLLSAFGRARFDEILVRVESDRHYRGWRSAHH